jgi:Domain of unknown function (DUF3244)
MSNLIVFNQFGKIKKPINWLLVTLGSLLLAGFAAIMYHRWKKSKIALEEEIKTISNDFSAKIAFDKQSNILSIEIQSAEKQDLTLHIINDQLQKISDKTFTEATQKFDLNNLPSGNYKCIISNQEKTIMQDFEKF